MIKVLVIGDACEDIYHYGKCERLAPEGPAPVFHKLFTERSPGMADNVLTNLLSLGVQAELLSQERSIHKIRFIEESTNHLLLREDTDSPSTKSKRIDPEKIGKEYLSQFDAVVVSDYDKGFLSETDLSNISSNHPVTFLDTKKIVGDWAFKFSYIKINAQEYHKLKTARPLLFLDKKSREYLYGSLIVTKGPEGCYYKKANYRVPKVEIRDFAGAGDTFLAGLVCKYLETKNMEEALVFANQCGTQVVQKKGVVCVQLPI